MSCVTGPTMTDEPRALPPGHVLLVGRVWRVDIAVTANGEPVVEATEDAEHGVLARLVPVPAEDES